MWKWKRNKTIQKKEKRIWKINFVTKKRKKNQFGDIYHSSDTVIRYLISKLWLEMSIPTLCSISIYELLRWHWNIIIRTQLSIWKPTWGSSRSERNISNENIQRSWFSSIADPSISPNRNEIINCDELGVSDRSNYWWNDECKSEIWVCMWWNVTSFNLCLQHLGLNFTFESISILCISLLILCLSLKFFTISDSSIQFCLNYSYWFRSSIVDLSRYRNSFSWYITEFWRGQLK